MGCDAKRKVIFDVYMETTTNRDNGQLVYVPGALWMKDPSVVSYWHCKEKSSQAMQRTKPMGKTDGTNDSTERSARIVTFRGSCASLSENAAACEKVGAGTTRASSVASLASRGCYVLCNKTRLEEAAAEQ